MSKAFGITSGILVLGAGTGLFLHGLINFLTGIWLVITRGGGFIALVGYTTEIGWGTMVLTEGVIFLVIAICLIIAGVFYLVDVIKRI